MANLLQMIESVAAAGAAGLAARARDELEAALRGRQCPDGGFAGLDGRSDPYYTCFGWLGMRALGRGGDLREEVCAYLRVARQRAARGSLDRRVVEVALLAEGRWPRCSGWLAAASQLPQGVIAGGAYEAFLLGLLVDTLLRNGIPCFVANGLFRRLSGWDFGRGPTSQLAALLALAVRAGNAGPRVSELGCALAARRAPGGGFVGAPAAAADLLATAVACFSLGAAGWIGAKEHETRQDLAFIEACWQDDGLFGPLPDMGRGDVEHTFYGLLALGALRRKEPA